MKYKKFKLHAELKRTLETLNSSLSQKVVGGMHGPDDTLRYDGCGAQCEITCAYYCRTGCEGGCGTQTQRER